MKKIYQILLLIILLLELNFFSIIELPSIISNINSYYVKKLIFILSMISLFFWLVFEVLTSKPIKRYYSSSVNMFLFSTLFISLLSIIVYNQSIVGVFTINYFYYIIVLYYFLTYYCIRDKSNYYFLINSIIVLGVIYSMLLVTQYFFFKFGLGSFLIFNDNNLVVLSKDTNPRIARPADFITLSVILLILKMIRGSNVNKSRFILWSSLIIMLSYIILVSQTRMYIITLLVIITLSVFLVRRKNKGIQIYLYSIFIVVILLIGSEIFINFFTSFTSGERLTSTNIRISEYLYYSKQIFENIIFGRGFPDVTIPEYFSLYYGPYGLYNTSDIGVIGFWSGFGLLGILFTLNVVIKIIKTFKNFKVNIQLQKYDEFVVITIYLLFISVTLFYTDIQRIIYLPIMLTILEMYYRESRLT